MMPVWLPILLIVFLIAGMVVCMYTRRVIRRTARVSSGSSAQELTADQLAAREPQGTAASRTRTRRNRRPRRTPSQISTTSLPAYMKEPGEQELVIFQGAQDMEDGSVLPEEFVMPSVAEGDIEGSVHSRDNSQASRYSPLPVASNDAPLLPNDQPPQDPSSPQNQRNHRNSADTSGSSMSSQNTPQAAPDPRGEVPPYFEVPPLQEPEPIASSTDHSSVHNSAPTSESAPLPPSNSAPPEHRRSGFRAFLNVFSNTASPSHSRVASRRQEAHNRTPSDHPPEVALTQETPPSASLHRPSPSGGSTSMFRPLSRERVNNTVSSNRMNSPSLLSLHSISAPLTHTLVRTEFTYPKSGPTPEQLKFISSVESLGRFGRPYGPDAIAYVASTSRQELSPPPDFNALSSNSRPSTADRSGSAAAADMRSATLPTSPLAQQVIEEASPIDSPTPPSETQPHASSSTTNHSPSRSPTVREAAATPSTAGPPPPPSFKYPPSFPRSDSRASSSLSNATYNTALESMGGSNVDTDSGPPTPGNSSQPALTMTERHEGTDLTVTMSAAAAAIAGNVNSNQS